jgi:hypothetical protein
MTATSLHEHAVRDYVGSTASHGTNPDTQWVICSS